MRHAHRQFDTSMPSNERREVEPRMDDGPAAADDHAGHHMPEPAAHAGHVSAHPAGAAAHTPTTPDKHAGHAATPAVAAHGGHGGHDMSDPTMAAAMERDMRDRFFVALALALPTFLYSPAADNLLGIDLPGPANWIMLLTTTPIVFWSGWTFISGAYFALKQRALDMSVLIATGVLAAYLFSVGLTVSGSGETFYEAAA